MTLVSNTAYPYLRLLAGYNYMTTNCLYQMSNYTQNCNSSRGLLGGEYGPLKCSYSTTTLDGVTNQTTRGETSP